MKHCCINNRKMLISITDNWGSNPAVSLTTQPHPTPWVNTEQCDRISWHGLKTVCNQTKKANKKWTVWRHSFWGISSIFHDSLWPLPPLTPNKGGNPLSIIYRQYVAEKKILLMMTSFTLNIHKISPQAWVHSPFDPREMCLSGLILCEQRWLSPFRGGRIQLLAFQRSFMGITEKLLILLWTLTLDAGSLKLLSFGV